MDFLKILVHATLQIGYSSTQFENPVHRPLNPSVNLKKRTNFDRQKGN